jgi:cupin fold WbuC family metalloprotein
MMIIDDTLLDGLMSRAKVNPRLREAMDLRDSATEGSQRMLNALAMGTVMPVHRHRETSETIFLLRGKMDEVFYDEKGHEVSRFHLDPREGRFGVQVPVGTWHSLEVLEDSVLFEAKNGVYEPLKKEDVMEVLHFL